MPDVLIIGASVAGAKVAQSLRAAGFEGEIVLTDMEDDPLYDKPPLSKAFLNGSATADDIALTTESALSQIGVEVRFGTSAIGLDTTAKSVTFADLSCLSYGTLIIATGARARLTDWSDSPHVHVLRTRDDADAFRPLVVDGQHLVVVGAGFIGVETAATARKGGMNVTVIEPLNKPMGRALNDEIGQAFTAKHIDEGVNFRFGTSVTGVETVGDRALLTLSDGSCLEADAVLLGIGAVPNTEWLESSGVTLENGVLCDPTLKARGVEDVYVIGDVARFESLRHASLLRLEHWTSATEQANIVAHNIVHPDDQRAYNGVEYVWSDQYDWKIQFVGRTGSSDYVVVGDLEASRFAVVHGAEGGAGEGAVVVNWPRALIASRQLLASGTSTEDLIARLAAL